MQLVEVPGHRDSGAIQIFGVMRRAKGLHLDRRNHVHVVDPITRLAGNAVGRGLLPLFVCQTLPHIQILALTGLHVNLERHHTEHSIIDVRLRGNMFRPIRGQQRIEFLDQSRLEVSVVRQLSHGQGAVPGADFRVNNVRPLALLEFQFTSDKVLGHAFADFLWRCSRGPIAKVRLG